MTTYKDCKVGVIQQMMMDSSEVGADAVLRHVGEGHGRAEVAPHCSCAMKRHIVLLLQVVGPDMRSSVIEG
jgi:hypothetical protein